MTIKELINLLEKSIKNGEFQETEEIKDIWLRDYSIRINDKEIRFKSYQDEINDLVDLKKHLETKIKNLETKIKK